MIDAPIRRHDTFTSSFCDRRGCFLDSDQLDDVVNKINNHEKLLQSLRDMVEIVGSNFCSNQDVKRKYKIARELLEQSK